MLIFFFGKSTDLKIKISDLLSFDDISETHSEPNQTSKMDRSAKIINRWDPLNTFAKSPI